jgi:hypothetical protein
MPPKDGLRLNHPGRAEQAWPEPGHPYQQRPITAVQSNTRRRTPQGDAELMTEKQVLGFKPAPRLEQIGDEHSERVQDRKHRSNDAMILRHDANLRRMKFSERTGSAPRDVAVRAACFAMTFPTRLSESSASLLTEIFVCIIKERGAALDAREVLFL